MSDCILCVWSHGKPHQTSLATCSVSGHLPAHLQTHIYIYAHTPRDRLGTSGSECHNFPFFFFFNLLTPGRHRHQTGISITFCHCCNATFGGLLPYNQQIHTKDVADLFLSFLIILISTLSRFQYVSSFLLFCLSFLSSSLIEFSLFFFFWCLKLQGISYANIDVQLWPASYQLKSANRWV